MNVVFIIFIIFLHHIANTTNLQKVMGLRKICGFRHEHCSSLNHKYKHECCQVLDRYLQGSECQEKVLMITKKMN